jgi:inhibitor of KinA sporulation pathway (predicted exonuclease)
MRNIINEIKWAWQRVVRGYDDRVYWGFDGYFLKIIPALEDFCKDYLKLDGGERAKLNPHRAEVFEKTIYLIAQYRQEENDWSSYGNEAQSELLEYIGKHARWYWD